jgi:plasmid stabilization system protein ParE
MIVKFLPEAEFELNEAIEWYAHKQFGLDTEFMRCIDEAISKIQRNPKLFPIALKNSRKALVKRFPFTIYYEHKNNAIMILAVFHVRRNPKDWQKRI